jgi:hypothetical protein
MSGAEVIVVIVACLCVAALWIDGNNRRRHEQTDLILRGLQRPMWNGHYDTCPECGVMLPCQALTSDPVVLAGREPSGAK